MDREGLWGLYPKTLSEGHHPVLLLYDIGRLLSPVIVYIEMYFFIALFFSAEGLCAACTNECLSVQMLISYVMQCYNLGFIRCFHLCFLTDEEIMVDIKHESNFALNWRLFTPGCFRQAIHRLFNDFREEENTL